MEIKDLAGLSQPLTKLIEVVASGIGVLSAPILTMVHARADAYAIKQVSSATQKNHDLLHIEYKNNHISINTDETQILNRANSRLAHQEITRQENIENIVRTTILELEHEKTVSTEPVDKDWITRFFNITQDISNDDMQLIWGKLLAGEVKKPKAYSLRTLEILKNLSSNDAAIFMKVAQFAISSSLTNFILADDAYLKTNHAISFMDLLQLTELGLIQRSLTFTLSPSSPELQTLTQGNIYISLAIATTIELPIHKFTTIGNELLSLIDITGNKDYIDKLSKDVKKNCTAIEYGTYDPESMNKLEVFYSFTD